MMKYSHTVRIAHNIYVYEKGARVISHNLAMDLTSTTVIPTRTKSEAELLQEGWTRRFVAAPARLREAVALYESLGYQVHLEPLTPEELREECADCRLAVALFRVIYTRRS